MFAQQKSEQTEERNGTFVTHYKVLGQPVCRDAFIACTGIYADTLQRARQAANTGLPVPEPNSLWVSRWPSAYMDARAWLLDYAKVHADTSPLNDRMLLPAGLKEYYYALCYRDRLVHDIAEERIASMTTFLDAWRQELPWIQIRTPSGPFTRCGVCEYLKMLLGKASDTSLRSILLARLGSHYDFQSAQRIAMTNLFRESERDPHELMAVAWDKMDQQKTIIPRVAALAHTAFQKSGQRLVMSLIGVLAPALWQAPLVYTIFPDCPHGGNMCASMMIEMLCQIHSRLAGLPRRLLIQADNTAKETKNTVCLFAACWVLAQLEHTNLQIIEFAYLIVGHTHDLIDAFFSLVNRAASKVDILSPPGLFGRIAAVLTNPPSWKHLQDQYDFQGAQPRTLKAQTIKGITQPHHYRVFWRRNGNMCIQSKRWLTDTVWSPPVAICTREDVRDLKATWPAELELNWQEDNFEKSFLKYLHSLEALFHASGRDTDELDHCAEIARHSNPCYLNSGETLREKICQLAGAGALPMSNSVSASEHMLDDDTVGHLFTSFDAYTGAPVRPFPLIHSTRMLDGAPAFDEEEVSDDMFVLYRWHDERLPVRLGRVLRCVREDGAAPYCIMESWWPLLKLEKIADKLNAFGTWCPCAEPIAAQFTCTDSKKQRTMKLKQLDIQRKTDIVNIEDVSLWPIDCEKGALHEDSSSPEGRRIPFPAFAELQRRCGINLADDRYAFSRRAKEYQAYVAAPASPSSSSSSSSS